MDALFAEPGTRKLLMQLHGEGDVSMKVVDAAYWMKGCSSLGRLRYAVLVRTGRKHGGRYHLIDVKEATAAAAPLDATAMMPADFAERVGVRCAGAVAIPGNADDGGQVRRCVCGSARA